MTNSETENKENRPKEKKELNPYIALMHLELAERFGLPKREMKSELEEIVLAIGNTDIIKEDREGVIGLIDGQDDYQATLDEAKKFGIKQEYISKAAYQLVRGILRSTEDYFNSDILEETQKNYSISNEDMLKAIMEHYHEEFI